MGLDRRAFLQAALMAGLAAMAAGRAAAAGPQTADAAFLNRLTFGATDADHARLAALGRSGWLAEQLALPPADPALDARLAAARLRIAYEAGDNGEGGTWAATDELRPLSSLRADPAALLALVDWTRAMDWAERVRPAEEVVAASLIRAVHAPAQLREVMTQFWHDHFNVHAQKNEYVAIAFPAHDATLRTHALGNFRTLLGAVAQSAAMLHYLDNADSRASPANENWARELLELHTLGAGNYLNAAHPRWETVPRLPDGTAAGYVDDDVFEVARAFTGWTVGDGRWIAEGVEAPRTGLFHYAEAWHDPYQKRILAREFPSHGAPMADGNRVLDILARHPGTAHFICEKIARRLLADDPAPALVARLATLFLAAADAPDQIAQVVRALATDPAFDAPPAKMRRPFEFLAALYRATGTEVAATENAWAWQLSRAGWHQHAWAPPDGHPDRAADWQAQTVLLRLVDLALDAHADWFGVNARPLGAALPAAVTTLGTLARHWSARLQGGTGEDPAPLLAGLGVGADDPLPADPGLRHDLSTVAVGMAALHPAFLFR